MQALSPVGFTYKATLVKLSMHMQLTYRQETSFKYRNYISLVAYRFTKQHIKNILTYQCVIITPACMCRHHFLIWSLPHAMNVSIHTPQDYINILVTTATSAYEYHNHHMPTHSHTNIYPCTLPIVSWFNYACHRISITLSLSHLSCRRMLYRWRKLPPNTRESIGVRTAWIQPAHTYVHMHT